MVRVNFLTRPSEECNDTGLEPGLLNLRSSVLTIGPQHSPSLFTEYYLRHLEWPEKACEIPCTYISQKKTDKLLTVGNLGLGSSGAFLKA